MAEEAGAPLGNALLAGAGVGLIKDLGATATQAVHIRQHFTPDPVRHDYYRRLFGVYKQVYPPLKPLYAELARC